MRVLLLQLVVLLLLPLGSNHVHADDLDAPPDCNVGPKSCGTGYYAGKTGRCPSGKGNVCLGVNVPPAPASLHCVTYSGGAMCEAWPQAVEFGLINYSWSTTGRLVAGSPTNTTSPQFYVNCSPHQSGTVTVVLTSPGYASSTVSETILCGDL